MTTVSPKFFRHINFMAKFIVVIVSNITLCNIFKYIGSKFWNTRKCANLDDHFSQYALLSWKNVIVLLTCSMP